MKKITEKLILLVLVILPLAFSAQTQIGQDIDGQEKEDLWGYAIALSEDGSIIAISSNDNDNINGENAGLVQVYENNAGTWTQIGQDIYGLDEGYALGVSVDLSANGNILAIGSSVSDTAPGRAQVYENIAGTWTQIGQDINGSTNFVLGSELTLSADGSILAIDVSGSDSFTGHVEIYKNEGGTWVQIGQDIKGLYGYGFFGLGSSLSADGSIVTISGSNGDNDRAVAYVYENQGGTWVQISQEIEGSLASEYENFSLSLSSDGKTLAIGASERSFDLDDNPQHGKGYVKFYEYRTGGDWEETASLSGNEIGQGFGSSISLSSDGSIIAIGSTEYDLGQSGKVELYSNQIQPGTWVKIGQDIVGEDLDDAFGVTVSLSNDGKTVAASSLLHDEEKGHVRIYDLNDLLSTNKFSVSKFKLFPNPASKHVTIELKGNDVLQKFNIINSLGQLISTSHTKTLNTSNLSKGVYFVEVVTNKGIGTKTLIIE